MELSEKQYRRIAGLLPVQRGNVKISNRVLLSALIYRLENGCKRQALPKTFGKRHTIYIRFDRRSAKGALERVYNALDAEGLFVKGVCALDSTSIKARPDAHGAPKKTARRQ